MAFKETVSRRIIRILKDAFGSATFKAYYDEDVLSIPQSCLPALIVEKERTTSVLGPTGMDRQEHSITVKIVFNKKDVFGRNPDDATVQRRLEELAEGVDDTTNEYSQSSVLGVLRKNITLGLAAQDMTSEVEYGINERGQDVITAEAHISVVVTDLITVTGRS